MADSDIIKSNIPVDIRNKISEDANIHDPLLRRLEMVQVLATDPKNDLTELSEDECIDFAIIRALDETGVIKLDGVLKFLDYLKSNRVSLDRKRTDEYLKGLIGQVNGQLQPMPYYGSPGTVQPEEKGLMDKLMFWR
jgi:hypothetical protein